MRLNKVPLSLPKQTCCLLSGSGKPSQFLCKWRIMQLLSNSVLKLSVQEQCGNCASSTAQRLTYNIYNITYNILRGKYILSIESPLTNNIKKNPVFQFSSVRQQHKTFPKLLCFMVSTIRRRGRALLEFSTLQRDRLVLRQMKNGFLKTELLLSTLVFRSKIALQACRSPY